MFKIFVSLLIISSGILWADTSSSDLKKTTLQAESIYGDSENLYAKGHIRLVYMGTKFMADFAHYDKINKRLVVYGSVQILNPNGSKVKTDKITLNIKNDNILFEKFFYSDKKNGWFSSSLAVKEEDCYKFSKAIFSTCITNNPDWHLGFAQAEYSSETKYVKLKDIKFYIGETPIFYFPYLAFSTSKERSSGLLMPYVGYGAKDGFFYEQPIYWAISQSMDVEFNPQLRTNRGIGFYSTLRFADSNHSEGIVRLGYFKDKDSFTLDNNLKHIEHYGIEGIYKSSDILGQSKPNNMDDALYVNTVLFNDIDYLNLQRKTLMHLSDSHLKESRLNYMLYNDDYYFGINAKYFLDASKAKNNKTLQEIPSFRWHKYEKHLLFDNLSYSIDVRLGNYLRGNNSGSRQFEASVPLIQQFSLLDDYLKLELSEELYLFWGDFENELGEKDKYSTVFTTHKAKLYSDFMKSYESGMHTMQWAATFEKQNYIGDGLTKYDLLADSTKKDFLSRKPYDERVTLSFGQYWHSKDLSLDLKQRISQTYYPKRNEKWGDLRHELEFGYGKWTAINLMEYSYEKHSFSEMTNKLIYDGDNLRFHMDYFWRKNLDLAKVMTNEIAIGAEYKYNDRIDLFASATYDLDTKRSKKWTSGFKYDKGCWGIELSYQHDINPTLELDGGGSISNNTLLIKLNLAPFGESEIRR